MGRFTVGPANGDFSSPREISSPSVVAISSPIQQAQETIVETREVPVIREVIKEVIIDRFVPVEVIREVIKEVPVIQEVIKEIYIEKIVPQYREIEIEKIIEIPKIVFKPKLFIPSWIWLVLGVETLLILVILSIK